MPAKRPTTTPIAIGNNIIKANVTNKEVELPDNIAPINDVILKNTTIAKISSRAAIGISELVTGPSVLNSDTIDKAGAGAVASAIPPNTTAKNNGIFIK